jgi:ketosteroid isomerase-like protein
VPINANKKIATRMIECLSEGVLDTSPVSSDAQWWVPGRGMMDRATFENILRKFNEIRAGKGEMKIVGMTAEDNRVAVEAEANIPLKNGTIYQNTYHFLFIITDGKIVLSKEYNDSLYASSALAGLF